MGKLPKEHKFFDLSDYGRTSGYWIAKQLKDTSFTSIHVTTLFVLVGFLAVAFILNEYYKTAAVLIIIKSILDAADGVTYELDGATVTGAQFLAGYFGATTSRTITFAVPTNPATTSVWYGCSVHPLQGGELTFSDPNSQQGGFQLVVDTLGGTISEFIVNAPGDGNYQVGDVISVAPSDLYDANSADAATPGSGLQITLGGNFGAIAALDQISLFGSGYAVGDTLG